MAQNGRLPASDLAAIPGGRLRKDAAASWLRLRQRIHKETGIWIAPTSTRTAYRPYADQQYFWNLYQSGRGALAARPGTSNHGWGLAVDLPTAAMQAAMRKYGPEYGWGIRGASLGSDAPSEAWHALYHPDKDRHKGEPAKIKKPDVAYLNDDEAALRRRLLRLREQSKKSGNWGATKAERQKVRSQIRAKRASIKANAIKDGSKAKPNWTKYNRRQRYNALGRLLK